MKLKNVLFRVRSRWPLFLVYHRMSPQVLGKAGGAAGVELDQHPLNVVRIARDSAID
jgi:hypothetical protein